MVPVLGETDSSPVLVTSDSFTYSIGGEFVKLNSAAECCLEGFWVKRTDVGVRRVRF